MAETHMIFDQQPGISDSNDTIVAVSTAAGPSSRAIVRMSGPRALEFLGGMIGAAQARHLPRKNYRAFPADILLGELRLPVRVYIMRAPTSYTREDIVELHVFGAPPLLAALLEELTRRGCRPAGPGEFTRRAFLNGRVDLAQAEAVEILIRARSEAEYRAALGVISGHLSRRTHSVRERLADLAAAVEASLDFSDQDIEIISYREVVDRLRSLRDELGELLAGKDDGRLPSHGLKAVLFGPPNAGKSSLFNAMLKRQRAIVSPHPGTTRDTIEATVALNGLALLLVDTAGLRPPDDDVEALAVSRSHDSIRRADLALCVLDSVSPPGPDTHDSIQVLDPDRALILLNKCDLGPAHPRLLQLLPQGVETVSVSAITGEGIWRALQRIRERVEQGLVYRGPSELMINARQADLVRRTLTAIDRVLADDTETHTMDLVASDIREALLSLSELTDGSVTEDVLDRIFSTFCIGK